MRKKRRAMFAEIIESQEHSPMEGFLELLKILKKHKMKIGVASNRNIEIVHLILKKLHVFEIFDCIQGPSLSIRHKPHPDVYRAAAKLLSVSSEECVAIEDSEIGVLSAYAARMKVIAVPHKHTHHHDFFKKQIE